MNLNKMEDRHWSEKLTNTLDHNIRKIQYGIYSIAVFGLAIVVHRGFRPFTKFTSPKDIPAYFVHKHMKLNGNVLNLDLSTKPMLLVSHTPTIGSRFRKPGTGLPIQILGIDINSNGISWMQNVLIGKDITFRPVMVQPDSVSCIVTIKKEDIALRLITIGFASTSSFEMNLEPDKLYKKYYKTLLKEEEHAEKRGIGMWADDRSVSFTSYVSSLLKTLLRR